MKATLLGESCNCEDRAQAGRMAEATHSLKSLRWESFRWTGLGQKT